MLFCSSTNPKKNGLQNGSQKYKCKACGRQFLSIRRLATKELYLEYLFGKQTFKQLSDRHQVSTKTVQRKLHQYRSYRLISRDKSVVVLMDTT